MKNRSKLLSAIAVWAIVALGHSTHAEVMEWVNAGGGSWNNAAHWDPADVPDESGEAARVPNDGLGYTITLDISPTIDWFELQNPNAELTLGGQTLTVLLAAGISNSGLILAGQQTVGGMDGHLWNRDTGQIAVASDAELVLYGPTLTNEGLILVNNFPSDFNDAILRIAANLDLTGTGELRLNDIGEDAQLNTDVGVLLMHGENHALRGYGWVNAALTNYGLVEADVAGKTLELRTTDKDNRGTIRAVNDAILAINDITITQRGVGQIVADGGTVRLLGDTSISGGSMQTGETGLIVSYSGTCALDSVTNFGQYVVGGSTTTTVLGSSLRNAGTIKLKQTSDFRDALLRFEHDALLQGGGELVLNDDGPDAQLHTADGVTLTNDSAHTIRGYGELHASLINNGAVWADVPNKTLYLVTNDKTNNATMGAVGGAELYLQAVSLTQDDDAELLADGGTIELRNYASVSGGKIRTVGDGAVLSYSFTNTLTDVDLDGDYRINGNSTTLVVGSLLRNAGTILVKTNPADSYDAFLRFEDSVTIEGDGEIILNDDPPNAQITTAGDAMITLSETHTIRGRGEIRGAVTNYGLIQADVTHHPLRLRTDDKINRSTIQAINGSELEIEDIALDNVGGLILNDGSSVTIEDSAITGGTLRSSGSEPIVGLGAVTLTDVALVDGTRYEARGVDAVSDLAGTACVNDGVMAGTDRGVMAVSSESVTGVGEWFADDGTVRFGAGVSATTTGPLTITGTYAHLQLLGGAVVHGLYLAMDAVSQISVDGTIQLAEDFDFKITNEERWDWAPGSRLVMTGVSDTSGCNNLFWFTLEIGCRDNGTAGPDEEDFTISEIEIADGAIITFSDYRNNGNRTENREAMYLDALVLGELSVLNLNGSKLYVRNGDTWERVEVGSYGGGEIWDTPVPMAGDMNGDGVVNNFDIDGFVAVLSGVDQDPEHICAADVNADTLSNNFDIDVFVQMLIGG